MSQMLNATQDICPCSEVNPLYNKVKTPELSVDPCSYQSDHGRFFSLLLDSLSVSAGAPTE